MYITLRDKGATIKGSLHKFYYRVKYGRADNSGLFTMEQAVEAFSMLGEIVGIPLNRAVLRSYEIGYNIKVSKPAHKFVCKAVAILEAKEPTMFEDARFEADMQKSTRRDKKKKKYYKIYDKQFEVKTNQDRDIEPTLRIETGYKRQSKSLCDLLSVRGIKKVIRAFTKDWGSLVFTRSYKAVGNVKVSQIQKAIDIRTMGIEAFLIREKRKHQEGLITDKQYRIAREFARDYPQKHRDKVLELLSDEEKEYKQAITEIVTKI